MNGSTILPAAALAFVTIAGCAPPPSPPAAPAPAQARKPDDAGRRAEMEEADKLLRRGYPEAAKKRWRAMGDYPPAVASLALLENRPEAALALPMEDEPRLLGAQGRAATQLGDLEAVERILPRLAAAGSPDAAAWLSGWAAAARMARARRLLRVTSDAPASAPLDVTDDLPVIEVKLGARTTRFLLDTGADTTVIDPSLAERLGVRRPASGDVEGHSSAGVIRMSPALVERLEVLGLVVEDVPVALSPLDLHLLQRDVVGIMSAQQLFRRDVVTLDYAGKRVERSRRSRDEGWPLAYLAGRGVSVEGRLERGGDGLFFIDTGNPTPMVTPFYLKVGLANRAPWQVGQPQQGTMAGVGASQPATIWPVDGCRFCARGEGPCLDLPRVLAWDGFAASVQGLTGIEHVGVLGGAAFQGRVLEIDYPALRLRIRPGT